jgi:DNA mismatch endonuclease (patch repair protein)
MARVRGRHTRPEVALRRALWRAGLRYRLHVKLPGRPDLAFVGARLALFVDGCFWHGCPQHYSAPATRAGFWARKLAENTARDARSDAALRDAGWRPLHIWEHELRRGLPEAVLDRVRVALRSRVSEAVVPYEPRGSGPGHHPWWHCGACGSDDALVTEVQGSGSLAAGAKRRPTSASVLCRACGRTRVGVDIK